MHVRNTHVQKFTQSQEKWSFFYAKSNNSVNFSTYKKRTKIIPITRCDRDEREGEMEINKAIQTSKEVCGFQIPYQCRLLPRNYSGYWLSVQSLCSCLRPQKGNAYRQQYPLSVA